jgi:hypothetical protein
VPGAPGRQTCLRAKLLALNRQTEVADLSLELLAPVAAQWQKNTFLQLARQAWFDRPGGRG